MAESVDYKIDNKDLIAAIRNYECLYRRKHPDYKNAKVKEAAWESVAQMVSNTSYNCKQRWRSLTDRNRKEIAHSGSGRKPWKLKDEMAFFNEALQADSAAPHPIGATNHKLASISSNGSSKKLAVSTGMDHNEMSVRGVGSTIYFVCRGSFWIGTSKQR
ncbi:transcription factor Adf-1-like isoform X3 [Eurosta solidaginis]|uniref:transcription factor Adf-1-like isoform X3 n=1 Tax=Eurosta solidaginis TaxID=178769 RepID=UPI00353178FF